ncbi:MAG: SMP-30/gluconolactonase/LRE family protein [Chloroflexi bacterium]|nr:SMP-30/gluconolactonase/LRE family protein [Chloroflexota bacterium]
MRRTLVAGLSAILSVGVLGSGTSRGASPAASVQARSVCTQHAEVARVRSLRGRLEVRHRNGPAHGARAGTALVAGDRLDTARGQRALIQFCDGSALYLNQQSEARLASAHATRVARGEVLQVTMGQARHQVGTAEAAMNGPVFDVRAETSGTQVVGVRGMVTVHDPAGQVVLQPNQATTVQPNRPPQPPHAVNAADATSWSGSLPRTALPPAWSILWTEQLQRPYGVALDGQGNLYVTINDRIAKLSPQGKLLAQWGNRGDYPGEFVSPYGVALDSQGNVYVADHGNCRIQKLSPSGAALAAIGTKPNRRCSADPGIVGVPDGVALDPQGNIYVADTGNNRVQKFSPDGAPLAQWGRQGSGRGQFSQPEGIALDPQGNIYVSDSGNNRLQELSPTGQPLRVWGQGGDVFAGFHNPAGLAIDAKGHLYEVDGGGAVQEFSTATGKFIARWDNQSSPPLPIGAPWGAAVDSQGNVYVAGVGGSSPQFGAIFKLTVAG